MDKSALYPRMTWNECLEFIKTVSSFHLKTVSYTEVAKKYGLTNPRAKSFTFRLSSCKQFGLITTSEGSIQLTDTARRLLFPIGDTAPIARECFALPPLYARLIKIYDGKALPTPITLANILMQEHKIIENSKDAAAKAFLESAEQLSLIKGGILCYSDFETSELTERDFSKQYISHEEVKEEGGGGASVSSPTQSLAYKPSEYVTQEIAFENGKVASFSIPTDATEDDILLLHDLFDVILRRKFKFQG